MNLITLVLLLLLPVPLSDMTSVDPPRAFQLSREREREKLLWLEKQLGHCLKI